MPVPPKSVFGEVDPAALKLSLPGPAEYSAPPAVPEKLMEEPAAPNSVLGLAPPTMVVESPDPLANSSPEPLLKIVSCEEGTAEHRLLSRVTMIVLLDESLPMNSEEDEPRK